MKRTARGRRAVAAMVAARPPHRGHHLVWHRPWSSLAFRLLRYRSGCNQPAGGNSAGTEHHIEIGALLGRAANRLRQR